MINTLNIQYPGNAKPILYVYIVPDENYAKLLRIPNYYNTGNGGGKPVTCYDLDGFNAAYGISQNMAEDKVFETFNISKLENELHELSHIIHSEFFSTNPTICVNNDPFLSDAAHAVPFLLVALQREYPPRSVHLS